MFFLFIVKILLLYLTKVKKKRLRNGLKDVSEASYVEYKTQDIFLTSFVRHECLKDVSETSCVY